MKFFSMITPILLIVFLSHQNILYSQITSKKYIHPPDINSSIKLGLISSPGDELDYSIDPREFISNNEDSKAILKGAIKSEEIKLVGNEWITTCRGIVTYENGLEIKNGEQHFDENGMYEYYYATTKFYDYLRRIEKVKIHIWNHTSYYNYRDDGKLSEILTLQKDGSSVNRIVFLYNNLGNLIESLKQYWSGNEWRTSYKYIYTYDANNFLVEKLELQPSYSGWINSKRTTYLNNPSGYPIEEIIRTYVGTKEIKSKYEYLRTINNLVSQSIYSDWNEVNSTWQPVKKYEYSYTLDNKPLLTLGYSWNGSQWVNDYQKIFRIFPNSSLMIIMPASGQKFLNDFSVSWISVGASKVDIHFSSNNGLSWVTLAVNIPDTGDYKFNYIFSSVNYYKTCKVKVSSSSNPFLYDINLGSFSVTSEEIYLASQHHFNVNELKLQIDNKGEISDIFGYGIPTLPFLYSGGFYLSGLTNSELWANGVLSSSFIRDYMPGKSGSSTNPPIYVVKSDNFDFGAVWQAWKEAVQHGASFYDGNKDGIYNPVDLNKNGVWDINEDRPDFISKQTAWCIYNDGVPPNLRRIKDVSPQGIEIQQTMFASSDQNSFASNIVFIRYRIKNTGLLTNKFDSVYFSLAFDADLGDPDDDLVGCDTSISAGYTYQLTIDQVYGNNPPVFLVRLLQGPYAYVPGVSFIDNNSNQLFDETIDTPIDSAYQKNGPVLGVKVLPGAMNLPLTSFTHYMNSDPMHRDPNTRFHLMNYMLGGRRSNGEPINVCNWPFGNGSQLTNCSQINPLFMYSGDPVTNEGWLNISPHDHRMMLNSGPFRLEVNKPVDIIAAFIRYQGSDPLNSISVAKQIAQAAKMFYDSNFVNLLPTVVFSGEDKLFSFNLYQNFPNPFNSSTVIRYTVPSKDRNLFSGLRSDFATLKVYDILGNEIEILVNEEKSPGTYEVTWNATGFPSGVYFYQLRVSSFVETKKMVLLR